jgi:hypothetical protein
MKRTTIMVDEALLYDLQRIARAQKKTSSAVIREALEAYVTDQHEKSPMANPLLALIGIFDEGEPTDVSDGDDEEILRQGIHPIYGWSSHDESNDHGHELPIRADEQERQRPRKMRSRRKKPARKPAAARDRTA